MPFSYDRPDLEVPFGPLTNASTPRSTRKNISRRQYLRAMYESVVEVSNSWPITMTCTKEENGDFQVVNVRSSDEPRVGEHEITIVFDYEFALIDPREDLSEVVKQDIPELEAYILIYVAEEIGVRTCDLANQNIPLFNPSSKLLTPMQENQHNVDVISLSSFSPDEVDLTVGDCQYITLPNELDPPWICVPLKGVMNATYIGTAEDADAVQSFLSYHIERVINGDDIVRGVVADALFIGSRPCCDQDPDVAVETSRGIDTSSSSYVGLASGLSVAAFLGLLLIFFVVVRRRRKDEPETIEKRALSQSDGSMRAVPTKTMETGSGDETDRCGSPDREVPASTEGPVSLLSGPIPLASTRTTSLTVASTVGDDGSEIQYVDSQAKTATADNVSEETEIPPQIPTTVGATASIPDVLPPKPPTAPSSKPPVALRQRRKRKKKKRKAKMVKSSSREKINEMETITEGGEDEENSADSADEGSEYSWYSTSDSEPGSRDPSPSRSVGRSPARGMSPSRSPGTRSRDPSPSPSTGSIGEAADELSDKEVISPPANLLPPAWV